MIQLTADRATHCNTLQHTATQNLEIILQSFNFSTRRTRISMGIIVSTMLLRGTNRKSMLQHTTHLTPCNTPHSATHAPNTTPTQQTTHLILHPATHYTHDTPQYTTSCNTCTSYYTHATSQTTPMQHRHASMRRVCVSTYMYTNIQIYVCVSTYMFKYHTYTCTVCCSVLQCVAVCCSDRHASVRRVCVRCCH